MPTPWREIQRVLFSLGEEARHRGVGRSSPSHFWCSVAPRSRRRRLPHPISALLGRMQRRVVRGCAKRGVANETRRAALMEAVGTRASELDAVVKWQDDQWSTCKRQPRRGRRHEVQRDNIGTDDLGSHQLISFSSRF